MRPVLFILGGLRIYSYWFMTYLGMVVAVITGYYLAQAFALDPQNIFIAMIVLLVPALFGARLLYVIKNWKRFTRHRNLIWQRSTGGMSVYGMLVAIPLSIPLLSFLKVPFALFWDISVVCFVAGMIFARVGCLLNGCCSGKPSNSRIAIYLPDHDQVWCRRIPTQLIEIAWLSVLLVAISVFWKPSGNAGNVFIYTISGYSAMRFVTDKYRNHENRKSLSLNRKISLLLTITGVGFFIIHQL